MVPQRYQMEWILRIAWRNDVLPRMESAERVHWGQEKGAKYELCGQCTPDVC